MRIFVYATPAPSCDRRTGQPVAGGTHDATRRLYDMTFHCLRAGGDASYTAAETNRAKPKSHISMFSVTMNLLRIDRTRCTKATSPECHDCRQTYSAEHTITCTHCHGASCYSYFRKRVEELDNKWWARLRCSQYDWMFWLVAFLGGSERRTEGLVGVILCQKYSKALLCMHNAIGDGDGDCAVCCERSVSGFRSCSGCSFPMCAHCFLQNWGRGTLFTSCPGCRRALDTPKLLMKLGVDKLFAIN